MIELKQALRLEGNEQVAFVGAGGKTTAIFQVARQFLGPVIVTTSTHLAQDQLAQADRHIVVNGADDIAGLTSGQLKAEEGIENFVVAISGQPLEDGRVSGLDDAALQALSNLAWKQGWPVLFEADGARERALKAPAAHEPAIPDFADEVVAVAGLSALGQPLSEAWVHRPERFAELSKRGVGEAITLEDIIQVMNHPEGGLKNIPEGVRRVALLNQVEGDALAAAAQRAAAPLLSRYQAVLAASLGGKGGVNAVYEQTAGILLAAGASKRLGNLKQVLDWKGKPFVRCAAETGLKAGLHPMVVVTGAYADQVRNALDGLDVQLVHNADWDLGQSSSVKAGLAAVPEEAGAAIFQVVDQPQLPVALLEELMAEHVRSLAPIVATQVDGHRSNPVLFDRRTFPDFAQISGDIGGRAIFSKFPVTWVEWLDASLAIDVDSPEDYAQLLSAAG